MIYHKKERESVRVGSETKRERKKEKSPGS